jgi:hypothetical protein
MFIRTKYLLGQQCLQLLLSQFQKHLPPPDLFSLSFISVIRQLNFNVRTNLLTSFCLYILVAYFATLMSVFVDCFSRVSVKGVNILQVKEDRRIRS